MLGIKEIIIIIGAAIALFFLFRGINLWYWKINDLIKNQERHEVLLITQNKLLEDIFIQLGGKTENTNQKLKQNKLSQIDNLDKDAVDNIKSKITKDELIVKIKQNGKIEKMKKSDWNEIVEIGNQDKFELLYNNEN
jgi:hypothetical protein